MFVCLFCPELLTQVFTSTFLRMVSGVPYLPLFCSGHVIPIRISKYQYVPNRHVEPMCRCSVLGIFALTYFLKLLTIYTFQVAGT